MEIRPALQLVHEKAMAGARGAAGGGPLDQRAVGIKLQHRLRVGGTNRRELSGGAAQAAGQRVQGPMAKGIRLRDSGRLFWSSDQLPVPRMHRLSVAVAKAQFSALLARVEGGQEVVITRRGVAIARIVPEPAQPPAAFDLEELFRFTDTQPMHAGPDAGTVLSELRRDARY